MTALYATLGVGTVFGVAKLTDTVLKKAKPAEEQFRSILSLGIGLTAYTGLSFLAAARGWPVASLRQTGALTICGMALLACGRAAYRSIYAVRELENSGPKKLALGVRGKSSAQLDTLITQQKQAIAQNLNELSKEWARYIIKCAFEFIADGTNLNKKLLEGLLIPKYQHVVALATQPGASVDKRTVVSWVDPVSTKTPESITDPREKVIFSLFSTVEDGIRQLHQVRKLHQDDKAPYRTQLDLLDARETLLADLKALEDDKSFWISQQHLTDLVQNPQPWHWYIRL